MNLTIEQAKAVNLEGNNIIVSAGAGSGKTAVLSERVIRKLKDGVDIRNILMLTFTNEAAGEMANRIRKKIKEAGLNSQLEYLDQAYITTFDAFALNLVKKYHYVLNMSKDISIIDASIINLKKNEFLDEIFADFYKKKDAKFLKLIEDFTNRDDATLKEAILNINKALDLKYEKNQYLDNYVNNFYNKDYIDKIFNEYFEYTKSLATSLEEGILEMSSFMDEGAYQKLYESVQNLFGPHSYNDLYRYKDVTIAKFNKLDEEGKDLKESILKTYNELKELIYYSEDALKEEYLSTKDYVEVIIKIIKMLDKKINTYKKENDSYEFTDIAKMAIKIVKENESIRNELKSKFNEIMIDEYQDTSDLQEEFIKYLENKNVYMVGDIKQSIYRFRNANPLIFKNKYDKYSKEDGGTKIDLLKNFRSREEVLLNINEIFERLMTKDLGGINYKESHAMVFGNTSYITSGKNENNNYMDIYAYDSVDKKYSCDEIEGFIIANDIKKKVDSGYFVYDFDLKQNRCVTYNDFCIILDRNSAMDKIKKIFEYFNIPMSIYKDNNLMDEDDISIIKNIINLVISIKNEKFDKSFRYYFTSVARSYIGGLSDKEIFDALENNGIFRTDIYRICKEISLDFDKLTPGMLLRRIIDKFCFYEKFILVGNVDAAIKRMTYLLDLSESIEELGFTNEDFSKYLEDLKSTKSEIKYKEAKTSSDSVKMMNIHKSKGLEFPICYFAGFSKKFNVSDLKERFLFNNRYGIVTPIFNDGIDNTFVKTLVKNEYYKEEIAEKIRLFYVSLTRAKEKIIMVMPQVKNKNKFCEEVDFLEGLSFGSFYNFLESIYGNISKYVKSINLEDINLTKSYEFSKSLTKNLGKCENKMVIYDDEEDYFQVENKHASKTIKDVLTKEDASTLEFGTKMHELFELTNFKTVKTDNKYINKLLENFDFQNAEIYQELEFVYEKDGTCYHGIIDLMLEYFDKIYIVDYKLKNIDDDAYIKQLSVYYDYVKSITDKDVYLYLYSIMDNKVKIVEVEK